MQKTITAMGLMGLASASMSYGGNAGSSAPAAYASSSAPAVYAPSSAPAVYASSSAPVVYASSSSSVPAAPSASGQPGCWSSCYSKYGVTSEAALCGNEDVSCCIRDTCDSSDASSYKSWYDGYCNAPSPSSSAVVSSSSGFAVYPSSASAVYSSPPSPQPTPVCSCWSKCFEAGDITSQDELCGNSGVSKCIHDTCSSAEDKKYWAWYDGYCQVASSSSASAVVYSTSTPVTSATPSATPSNCWNTCFAASSITSESELCGNDAVSACIHDTCSSALDHAYWDWYNSYCAPTTTEIVSTVTGGYSTATGATETWGTVTGATETATVTGGIYTTTATWNWPSGGQSPPPAAPTAPAYPSSPVGASPPYPSAGTPTAGGWGATGTGAAYPSQSGWVPSTGGAASLQAGGLAAAGALVALLL